MNDARISAFMEQLRREEKSETTVKQYGRDAERFLRWLLGRTPSKELTLAYKQHLLAQALSPASVNTALAAVNRLLRWMGREDCRVNALRQQRPAYRPEERELTEGDYRCLLRAAEGRPRLYLLLQTLGGTGIRVSELCHFTVEAVRRGEVTVTAKGKSRRILLPSRLKARLLRYAAGLGLTEGPIFRTAGGRPLDRSNIWAEMKSLCAAAGVARSKVFPHNLRRLFARCFYALDKDLSKLADLMGHSSINTTRIYIATSGREHRRLMERMHLIL